MAAKKCPLCKSDLVKKSSYKVGDTNYDIYKCPNEKCNYQAAKSE